MVLMDEIKSKVLITFSIIKQNGFSFTLDIVCFYG